MYGETRKSSIAGVEKINIIDYLETFLQELSELESRKANLKTVGGASRIKALINDPQNTIFKSLKDIRSDQPYWDQQEVDFITSNLGENKGFIFYFICNRCQRRAKYLYFLSSLDAPLCRMCCQLQYPQPNRRTRALSRLIHKDYLSTEAKYALMKRAGINKDDIANYLSDFDPH